MIYVVELRAVYRDAGTSVSQTKRNQVAADMDQAQDALDAVSRFPVPADEEWLRIFENRYGFGWECRAWINVRADADQVGRLIWNRITTRGLRDGTHLDVYEDAIDEGEPWRTGELVFKRSIPPQPEDIG